VSFETPGDEAGKWADLVVLRANPLDDIRYTREVELVMKRGRVYRRE
jgi:imidazolonepropionase-like amidohydrolase